MRKINILTANNNPNSFSFIFPFLANKNRLEERGIKIRPVYSVRAARDSDILFVDSKFFKYLWRDRAEDVYGFLETARRGTGSVLWFDTADSTGTPNFQVLPYVDGYYKNQALKDRRAYLNRYYRDRIYFDYYHRRFGLADEGETGCGCLPDEKDIDKIHVSWNQALSDHGIFGNNYSLWGSIKSRIRRYYPRAAYSARFTGSGRARRIDIAARFGLSHRRNIVRYHRGLLAKELERFGVDTAPVDRITYYRELENSKISVSPFGLGEITYKDFESILCGALLVKPDMGHMETWPDLYKEGETYVKCGWDFSDITGRIKGLLAEPERITRISAAAQENYRYYLSGRGRDEFCDRVGEIAKRHTK
jgi:hypothetical protein